MSGAPWWKKKVSILNAHSSAEHRKGDATKKHFFLKFIWSRALAAEAGQPAWPRCCCKHCSYWRKSIENAEFQTPKATSDLIMPAVGIQVLSEWRGLTLCIGHSLCEGALYSAMWFMEWICMCVHASTKGQTRQIRVDTTGRPCYLHGRRGVSLTNSQMTKNDRNRSEYVKDKSTSGLWLMASLLAVCQLTNQITSFRNFLLRWCAEYIF